MASICVTMYAFLCYANFFFFHARVHGVIASICVTMCAFVLSFLLHERVYILL